jgi:peptidoglycan/xylan/chitin deacetylase (PgdA/CDA1 family)
MRRGLAWAREWLRSAAGTVRNALDAPVLVLLYHRVTRLARDPQQLAVQPENFRRQLQWLKARYPILRFAEPWHAAPRPAVVLTFDDGYADNAQQALPILEELGVPATFFVCTGNVDTRREFWWDEIERCLDAAPASARHFTLPAQSGGEHLASATAAERAALYEFLHRRLKTLPVAPREAALGALRAWAGVGEQGRESHRPLAVAELRALAESPWATVGAHGVSHAPLARLPREAQRAEIETSRSRLEAWIGRPVELFAYPFGGRADYDRESAALCRAAGFRKAAANLQSAWHRWHDEFHIPRCLVRDWDLPAFAAHVRRQFRR